METEKRFTEKHYNSNGYYLKCSEGCRYALCSDCDKLADAIDRLGEYEDKAEQTVDAVEVVRCKDCKYWGEEFGEEGTYCTNPDGMFSLVYPDNFCSSGERREE